MLQIHNVRYALLLAVFFFSSCWADSSFGIGLPAFLRTFRNYKRQGGTPGAPPNLQVPNTTLTPGLSQCVWAQNNAWAGCGLDWDNFYTYNQSGCNIPKNPINALQAPLQNCVAIGWFSWVDFESSDYNGNTVTIPLNKNYSYILSWTVNVIVDSITIYRADFGKTKYDVIQQTNPKNKSGLLPFTLKDNGDVHFMFGFDYGHPAGNLTLFQQPQDLGSLKSYASLISRLCLNDLFFLPSRRCSRSTSSTFCVRSTYVFAYRCASYEDNFIFSENSHNNVHNHYWIALRIHWTQYLIFDSIR